MIGLGLILAAVAVFLALRDRHDPTTLPKTWNRQAQGRPTSVALSDQLDELRRRARS